MTPPSAPHSTPGKERLLLQGEDLYDQGEVLTPYWYSVESGQGYSYIRAVCLHSTRRGTVALPCCKPCIIKALRKSSRYPKELITLGDHIRAKRFDLHLEQKDVAKILKVHKATIWNWENNRSEPEIQLYPHIMDFLGYCIYENATTWGEKLRLFRIYKGLSHRKLAKILSVDPASIRRWEEKTKPPWQKLRTKVEDYFY